MYKKSTEPKVLVVGDSQLTLHSIFAYLKRMDIEPLLAETGRDAIDLYRREQPDIVLLEDRFSGVDGFELAKVIRALDLRNDWTAIIFLTNMTGEEELARGIAAGGNDFLPKPVSESVLKAKMLAMRRLKEMQQRVNELTSKLNFTLVELQQRSAIDGLTGLTDRRMYDELALREWRRCEVSRKPMALVMVNVDCFTSYNERYGHHAGDACLKALAAQMRRAVPRSGNIVARYKAEVFVLALGETSLGTAVRIANDLRQRVEDMQIPHLASTLQQVTVSCGAAAVIPSDKVSMEALLQSAAYALSQAKEQGRNRTVYAELDLVNAP